MSGRSRKLSFHNSLWSREEFTMASSNNSGIMALLVVIVMLLIGGFLYTQMNEDDGPEIQVELPDVDIDGR